MDDKGKKLYEDIQTYGWHVVKVFDPEEELPDFAYSIGVYHTFQQPEIIIFGLDPDDQHIVINDVVKMVKSGTQIVIDKPYEDFIEGFACVFRPVDPKHYDEYFGIANWYYGERPFPALQCFWPDRNGRFPWEKNCLPGFTELQPLLFQ